MGMSLHCQLYTISGVKCGSALQGKIVLCEKHEESVKPRYVCEGGVCRMIKNTKETNAIIFTSNLLNADSMKHHLQQLGFNTIVKYLEVNEMQSQFGMDCSISEVFINDRYIDKSDPILNLEEDESKSMKPLNDLHFGSNTKMESNEAIIYSPSQFKCTYCDDANDLLLKHNYHVTTIKLSDQDLAKKFGASFTVPKIFIGDKYIGGFSDLKTFLTK